MMKGLSFPPLALVKNKHVSLSFDFLPPVQIWEAWSVSDLFGRALKNWPVSCTFQILQGCHLFRISGSLSVHESTICSLTSPDSTEINFRLKCMPVLFLKRSSHPFQALNCSPETWHMLIDGFLISPQGDFHIISKTITRAITVPYSLVVSYSLPCRQQLLWNYQFDFQHFFKRHDISFCKHIWLKQNWNNYSFLLRGYHVYQLKLFGRWKIGEVLDLIHELNNQHDNNAKVMRMLLKTYQLKGNS